MIVVYTIFLGARSVPQKLGSWVFKKKTLTLIQLSSARDLCQLEHGIMKHARCWWHASQCGFTADLFFHVKASEFPCYSFLKPRFWSFLAILKIFLRRKRKFPCYRFFNTWKKKVCVEGYWRISLECHTCYIRAIS